MDTSACVTFVNLHLPVLVPFLGLNHWNIHTTFRAIVETDTAAQCFASVDYEKCTLVFDPARIDTEDTLLDFLFHELSHLIGTPYDMVQVCVMSAIADPPLRKVIERVATYAAEQHALYLERIWRNRLRELYLAHFKSIRDKQSSIGDEIKDGKSSDQ